MTREEAINVIKGARQYLTVGNPIWNVKKVDEAIDMAIEALSADTHEIRTETHGVCSDLISRHNVLIALHESGLCYNNWLEVRNEINALPSAEAAQGEWTYLSGSKGSYMTISCPICGSTFDDVAEWKYHYCPNCGAKMKGGAE